MDNLFKIQEFFTRDFISGKYGKDIRELTDGEKVEITKDYVLHLHQEISSILGNVSYKMHRLAMDVPVNQNIFEEIVDTVKFALGLWVVLGKDWAAFEGAFKEKSQIVAWRIQQEKDLERLATSRVVVLDIDGVLAQYPGPFLEFVSSQSSRSFGSISEAKRGLGAIEYERVKELYRTSGQKRNLPLMPGAKGFVETLGQKGYPIVLVSSRPYEKYLNILGDTIAWANNSGFKFDAIYFDSRKGLKIAKRFPKAKLIVDDDPSFIEDIRNSRELGESEDLKIVLFDPSRKRTEPLEGTYLAHSFEEILDILETPNV